MESGPPQPSFAGSSSDASNLFESHNITKHLDARSKPA